METKFKDVANLYLGCEMIIESTGEKYIFKPSNMPSNWKDRHIRYGGKPILKHLSDITEGEAIELAKRLTDLWPVDTVFEAYKNTFDRWVVSWGNKPHQKFIIHPDELRPTTKQFLYLLSISVDIFNLIETGQAINAKTV